MVARAGRSLAAAALWCAALPSLGQTADPVAWFEAGARAFQDGRYGAAAHAFEQARAAGLERPALDYNLGVSYFRLGEYRRAAAWFRRLLNEPAFAPLAHYNLGLVARRLGEGRAAEEHFLQASLTGDDRLRSLAERQLEAPRAPSVPDRDWRAFALAGFGYDDNVNLIPTDIATSVADRFVEVYAVGSGVLAGTRRRGVSLHGRAYVQRYDEVTANDYTHLRVLGRGNRPLGGWDTFVGGFAARDTLAGDGFQRGVGIEAGARRVLHDDGVLILSYLHERIDSLDPDYDYLEGRRQELRAEYLRPWGAQDVGVAYEVEWNDREDTLLESYSPTRHTLRLEYDRRLDAQWRLGAHASYRRSDYPAAPALEREDERWRTRVSAARDFGRRWTVEGRWEHVDNRSNDPLRDYERNIYSMELQWLF